MEKSRGNARTSNYFSLLSEDGCGASGENDDAGGRVGKTVDAVGRVDNVVSSGPERSNAPENIDTGRSFRGRGRGGKDRGGLKRAEIKDDTARSTFDDHRKGFNNRGNTSRRFTNRNKTPVDRVCEYESWIKSMKTKHTISYRGVTIVGSGIPKPNVPVIFGSNMRKRVDFYEVLAVKKRIWQKLIDQSQCAMLIGGDVNTEFGFGRNTTFVSKEDSEDVSRRLNLDLNVGYRCDISNGRLVCVGRQHGNPRYFIMGITKNTTLSKTRCTIGCVCRI